MERILLIIINFGKNIYHRYKYRSDIKKRKIAQILTRKEKRAAKAYWKKYTKHFTPYWHEFFTAKSGNFDVRYIPEDVYFTEIEPCLNDYRDSMGMDNKSNYPLLFPEIEHPEILFRKMKGIYHGRDYSLISEEDAFKACVEIGGGCF